MSSSSSDSDMAAKLGQLNLDEIPPHGARSVDCYEKLKRIGHGAHELLLGSTNYGPAVDMWSAGCVFAKLLKGYLIFYGTSEAELTSEIFKVCGSPDASNWPGVSKLPLYNSLKPKKPIERRLRQDFRDFDSPTVDLLDQMLTLDPSRRISAEDALNADYFWIDPLPCDKTYSQSGNYPPYGYTGPGASGFSGSTGSSYRGEPYNPRGGRHGVSGGGIGPNMTPEEQHPRHQ